MPRVPDQLFDCVFFLYDNVINARNGVNEGGTGFIIGMYALPDDRFWHLYLVTNHHVVHTSGATVVRLNKKDGGHDIFETSVHEWIQHPEGDDVVILSIGAGEIEHCETQFVNSFDFMESHEQRYENLGPGDEIFMVGRFRGFEGVEVNRPVVRFGHISAMPDETHPIPVKNRLPQVGFVVEMRSQSGFSGSPVFAYIRAGDNRMDGFMQREFTGPYLIGIDFGQLNWMAPVLDRTGEHPVEDGHQVIVHTGFAGVVPVQKIVDLLFHPKIAKERKELDEDLAGALGRGEMTRPGIRFFSVRKGNVWKK